MNLCETCRHYHVQGVGGAMLDCCHHEGAINPVSHFVSEAPCLFQRNGAGLCGVEGVWWKPKAAKSN